MNVELLVFRHGSYRLAVLSAELIGVVPATVTPLPLAQPGHLGLAYHAGSVHAVFDARVILGLRAGLETPPPLVVLVDVRGEAVGLVCDRVEGTLSFPEEDLESGVIKTDSGPIRVPDLGDWLEVA